MFHFNKKHLEDDTIPMWVIKLRGETFYVNHVTCDVPWSTKETPDNTHTKGSIKVKNCLVVIDDDNCATITELTDADRSRLSGTRIPIRLITRFGKNLRDYLAQLSIEHNDVKLFGGGCGTAWYVVEIYTESEQLMLQLTISDLRALKPNEEYYRLYDNPDSEDDVDWEDLYEN